MASQEDSSTPIIDQQPEAADPKKEEAPPKQEAAPPKDAGAALTVFDGSPKDPPSAKRGAAPAAAPEEKKGAKKARKGKKPEPAEPTPEEEEADHARKVKQARGFLKTMINTQKMIVSRQYAEYFEGPELEALLDSLDLTEDELDALAEPLADGMTEEGINLPWWAQFAFALGGSGIPKRQMQVQAQLKRQVLHKRQQGPGDAAWDAEKGAQASA